VRFLDSSALIDALDPRAEHHDQARSAIEESPVQTWATPTIVLYELYRNRARAAGPDGVSELAERIEWVEPVNFTESAARESALIRAELMAEGDMINEWDILIGGVVRESGTAIVTRDSDFDSIDGLETITYTQ
jgi:tRNA(fMet)-specific endonuclease VapC